MPSSHSSDDAGNLSAAILNYCRLPAVKLLKEFQSRFIERRQNFVKWGFIVIFSVFMKVLQMNCFVFCFCSNSVMR